MQKYHKILVVTHWIVAFLMLTVMALVAAMTLISKLYPDQSSVRDILFAVFIGHETIGFFLLVFCIWRVLAYFLYRKTIPQSLNRRGGIFYFGEKLVHFFLRFCLILVPILGWMTGNAKGYPLKLFWHDYLRIPEIVTLGDPKQSATNIFYQNLLSAHKMLAYIAMLIVFMHIAGVLYHTAKKENILHRMKF